MSHDRESRARRQEHIARALIDAFNSRDPTAWVSLFHPDVEFRPTLLVGAGTVYTGHQGVLRYLDDLADRRADQRSRLRRIQAVSDDEFVVYTEVLVGDHVVSPAAVILRLAGDKIIEATAFLSDEETLKTTGRVPRTEAKEGDVSSS